MNKKYIIPVILAAVSVCLAILAFIILPETVIIQFSADSSGNTTAPKLFAVLLPALLGIGGALWALFTKDDEKTRGKGFLISVVGIAVFIIMLAVNMFVK